MFVLLCSPGAHYVDQIDLEELTATVHKLSSDYTHGAACAHFPNRQTDRQTHTNVKREKNLYNSRLKDELKDIRSRGTRKREGSATH